MRLLVLVAGWLVLFGGLASASTIAEGLDNNQFTYGSSGASAANWYFISSPNHDGVDAVRSGVVGDGMQSDLSTVVEGPGTVSFWWKSSSQASGGYYDILYFFYDGGLGLTQIFGDTDWAYKEVAIPAGSHTLYWSYAKDISGAAGADCGYVDQLVWTPEGGDTTPPGNVGGVAAAPSDGEVELTWTNPGDPDFAGVKIQRSDIEPPTNPDDGLTVFNAMGDVYTDTGLENGRPYFYTLFSYDSSDNHASGVSVQASPRVPPEFDARPIGAPIWHDVIASGHGNDAGRATSVDGDGNLIVAGYESGTRSETDLNGVLFSYDPEGTKTDIDTMDSSLGDSSDYFSCLALDADGNIYVGGWNAGDFPPYVNQSIVRKYTAAGAMAWERTHYAGAWNNTRAVAVDDDGNVYTACYEFGGWDSRVGQWAILKYGAEGVLAAGYPIHYNFSTSEGIRDYPSGIVICPNGDFVVSGYRGVMANNTYDIHVRRYTPAGALVWEDTYNGAANLHDLSSCVLVDEEGCLYVLGKTQKADEGYDWIMIKYGPDTEKSLAAAPRRWTKTYSFVEGKDATLAAGAFDGDGTIIVGGSFVDENDILQAVAARLDPVEGIYLAELRADLEVSNSVHGVAVRGNMLMTTGVLHNGTDWDTLTTRTRLSRFGAELWMIF